MAQRQAGTSAKAPAKPGHRKPATRTKPVRCTVDLPPVLFRQLSDWQSQAAEQLGESRITKQQILVALVHELLGDTDLEEAVLDRLNAE
ncbi:hypothetical protein HGA15_33215 [Nocardia flavorosea]|uniref:Uncharacterized protein n=1 Tax=Nocardia flavorosea TaxID=53429 RepID=A0A846YQ75_9NOCA|nr:hypothetical protein [Nocardia flavorosea]